jgi:hypothetical protein
VKSSKASWECKTVITMHRTANSNEVLLEILGGRFFLLKDIECLRTTNASQEGVGRALRKKHKSIVRRCSKSGKYL